MFIMIPCSVHTCQHSRIRCETLGVQIFKPQRHNQTGLNCAVASLGVWGFATSSRRSRTVSYEIQISNRSSVASLGVRGLATGSQKVVQR